MPPKVAQKTKEQKLKAALSGGKGRKKKWSKGKVKDKLMNAVLFDKTTYDKLMKEIPKKKLITTSIVSEMCKINGKFFYNFCREKLRIYACLGRFGLYFRGFKLGRSIWCVFWHRTVRPALPRLGLAGSHWFVLFSPDTNVYLPTTIDTLQYLITLESYTFGLFCCATKLITTSIVSEMCKINGIFLQFLPREIDTLLI